MHATLNDIAAAATGSANDEVTFELQQQAQQDEELSAKLRIMAAVLGRSIPWLTGPPTRTEEFGSFSETLEAAAKGNDQAVWEIIERYAGHLERTVRRRMDGRLRSKFDVEDFVQMVWVSFFRNPEQLRQFKAPNDVRNFLLTMARNKVVDENRRRLDTEKYNVDKECEMPGESTFASPQPNYDTPSQVAIARECWTRILAAEPERNQRIVSLRLRGWKFVDIAEDVGVSERTIRKVLTQLFEKNGISNRHSAC